MSDWSPLAGSDPIPGDPARVSELAKRLGTTAGIIKSQSGRLKAIQSDWWEGRAASEFEKHKDKLPPLLDQVATRYEKVSDALDNYHPDLLAAQTKAREALAKAKAAEIAIAAAKQGLIEMQQHAMAQQAQVATYNQNNPDGPPAQPAPWSGPDWGVALQQAEEEMDLARLMLDQAIDLRDGSARTAAGEVAAAIDDDLKNEGGFMGFVKRGARFLADVLPLEELSVILAVVAVALVFVVAAPFALVAAVAVAALLVDTVLYLADEKSGWELALSVVGVATLGIGKLAGALRGLRVVSNSARATTSVTAPGLRAFSATSSASVSIRSANVVGTVRRARTVVGISTSARIVETFESVTRVALLPGARFFPGAQRISQAVNTGIDLWNGTDAAPDLAFSVVELADEVFVEPHTRWVGFPSGVFHSGQEQLSERGERVEPVGVTE